MKKKSNLRDFDEVKFIKEMDKIFCVVPVSYRKSTFEEIKEFFRDGCILDESNVLAFIPKSERVVLLMQRYVEKDRQHQNVPKLDYASGELGPSGFSLDYLIPVLAVCNCTGKEKVKVFVKKDYPVTIESEEFSFIIAPRVDND